MLLYTEVSASAGFRQNPYRGFAGFAPGPQGGLTSAPTQLEILQSYAIMCSAVKRNLVSAYSAEAPHVYSCIIRSYHRRPSV